MKELKSILTDFAEAPLVLGDKSPDKPDVDNFRNNLESLRVRNDRYFVVLVAMVVVCFVVSLILLVYFKQNTVSMTAVFGATGLSIGGLVNVMLKIWKDKNQNDMLYALIGQLDDHTLRSVAAILAKSYVK